jgi:hypothetical protein
MLSPLLFAQIMSLKSGSKTLTQSAPQVSRHGQNLTCQSPILGFLISKILPVFADDWKSLSKVDFVNFF